MQKPTIELTRVDVTVSFDKSHFVVRGDVIVRQEELEATISSAGFTVSDCTFPGGIVYGTVMATGATIAQLNYLEERGFKRDIYQDITSSLSSRVLREGESYLLQKEIT